MRKLSLAVEQSPASVMITDTKGNITYVNPKFEDSTGYTSAEAIGQQASMISSGEKSSTEYQKLWKTISAGGEWRGEFHNKHKNGTLFWEYASISAIKNELGEITSYLAVKEDITQRKRDMAELIAAKEQAELASYAKTQFLANMSHELRTPLNAIIGYSEALRSGVFGPMHNERQSEYLGDIQNSGNHLLQLINDILDVSAIEAGKLDLREEPFSLIHAADSCIRLVHPRAIKGGVTVTRGPMTGVHSIYGDPRRIKQILINLLSNAVKFTNPGGHVEIDADILENGNCAIWVRDNGIGMSPQDLQKALLPFGQADSGLDRKYEGTGLGLPLSKNLITLHGGTISIESTPDKGTVVTVVLPHQRVQVDNNS
jgi:PAS domain S-box-containing protein